MSKRDNVRADWFTLSKYVQPVVWALVDNEATTATKFISPTRTVRAARVRYQGKIPQGPIQISLTIGRPNYTSCLFIKRCKKAGEPFPVKKIRLTFARCRKAAGKKTA